MIRYSLVALFRVAPPSGKRGLQDVLDRVSGDLGSYMVQLTSQENDVRLEVQVDATDVTGIYPQVASCLELFGRAIRVHWPRAQRGCSGPGLSLLHSQQAFG